MDVSFFLPISNEEKKCHFNHYSFVMDSNLFLHNVEIRLFQKRIVKYFIQFYYAQTIEKKKLVTITKKKEKKITMHPQQNEKISIPYAELSYKCGHDVSIPKPKAP